MNDKRILALDFGTQMGYAIYASKVVTSGTIGFHRKKVVRPYQMTT